MGIAARFSLGLGLFASLAAAIAAALMLQGVDRLAGEAVDDSLREMTSTTSELRDQGAQPPSSWAASSKTADNGRVVTGGRVKLRTRHGEEVEAQVYQAAGNTGMTTLYAPPDPAAGATDRILVLVVLVCAGMAAVVVLVGALTARRLASPLKDMVEDVLAISRGRLDRRIRGQNAAGEVAHLAVAVERMVDDLLAGQETEEALAASEEQAAGLQELRRNMQPMDFDRPTGWTVETRMLPAEGGGGGFVDAMSDGDGRCTVLVGAASASGMGAALLMATTRAYLRSSLLGGAEPAVACDFTNTSLNRDLVRGLYASAMVARADPRNGAIELVSAGHQAAAIRFDAAAGQLRKLQPNGIALGFDRGPVFRNALETVQLTMEVGDGLFLFSPELYAAVSLKGQEVGESGAAQLAKIALEQDLDAVVRRLESFLGGPPEADLGFALLRRDAAVSS